MKSWLCTHDAGGRAACVPFAKAGHARAKTGFAWWHIDGRVEAERHWLEQESGLPRHAVSALTAVETRPRSEDMGAGALVNLRGMGTHAELHEDPLVSIRLWASRDSVVSVSFRTLAALDKVRGRFEAGELADPGDLISALAILITRDLDPRIADLGDELDECETTLDPDNAFSMRRRIARVRSEAIGFRRFVVPQRQALERLSLLEADWLGEDDRLHLREAADRFARMGEELESVRERSALMHEQLTDLRSEQLETRALLLSIVALVFLPLTFLTGLLGMNVEGIPFKDEPWAFGGVVAVCAAMGVGIAYYFKRVHWFRR